MPACDEYAPRYARANRFWVWNCVRHMFLPAAVLVLSFAAAGILSSEYFALREVVVRAPTLSVARDVAGRIALPEGCTTFWFPLRTLVDAAEACPRVKRAVPVREYPGRIILNLEERRPAFCLQLEDGLHMADAEGVLLFTVARAPRDLPVVTGPVRHRHVRAGRLHADYTQAVISALTGAEKAKLGRHFALDLSTRYDYRMLTPEGTLVKLGGPDNIIHKVMVAAAAERKIRDNRQRAEYIDVRVPGGEVFWKPRGA